VQGSADLADVVDDVLRAADLRPATADPEPVDLVRLVAEVLDAERPRLREHGLHPYLVVAGPGWLPVEGVRTALRRAFSALADNAVAHTPPGGNVTVTVCADVGARFVEVAVRDDGRGFDPRHSRRLFARSVHGSAGSGRRHGIGLALVREIVESHGGTVTAYGCPGAGARFVVRLPLAREPIDGVVLPEARCPMRRLLGKTAA
jgi:two-component system, OmpR family, sensor kinase